MSKELDNFYLQKDEPLRGCLLALRDLILKQNESISPEWKYGMPFFYYKKKMFCYLWVNKKTGQPYIGLVDGKKLDHPELILEKRARMKIMPFNAAEDLPVVRIREILNEAIKIAELKLHKP
ncbi:DUF1801 domain-containing protein [Pedobacter cryoconitis]|uniref:YdhG-like domain-containing protein n=1 Tax=Pedobacter cryoconitis TaxID=188932 RepID=A0A7X0J424_9SPHI|nr:DUF1801 domain-containing protein [Pedobacter cryoconitis]MBB6499987.1 hypothetical protein [Pedobacter cryoconitis]